MFLHIPHFRSSWQMRCLPHRAPLCHVLGEEADCLGIIMIHLEVEEFVSLLAGILEEKTLGLQHVLNSSFVTAQVVGAKYTMQS